MMSGSWSSLASRAVSKSEARFLPSENIQEHRPILGVLREPRQTSSWLRLLVYCKPLWRV